MTLVIAATPLSKESAVAIESAVADLSRRDFRVSSPSGKNSAISAQGEQALIGPILECGLWTVAPSTESKDEGKPKAASKSKDTGIAKVYLGNGKADYRWTFASNLTNRSESDLKPRGELQTADLLSVVSLGGRAIWFYLALLGLVLLTTEWWLYQRRVVG